MRNTAGRTPAIAVAALAIGLGAIPAASAAPSAAVPVDQPVGEASPGASDSSHGGKLRSVTLITGDRVLLTAGSGPDAEVTQRGIVPGAGRERIRFRSYRVDGQLHVVPSDAQRLVASGRLDSRLFDVSALLTYGYDDARAGSVPVIATGRPSGGWASIAGTGAARPLEAVGGAALELPKSGLDGYWRGLVGESTAPRVLSGGVERLWLDGRREVLLDESVSQIDTEPAWRSGLTGKGVRVAVVDTGIDTEHPDLADQVVARKNFTSDPHTDVIGHGTHVASILAGTGKASDGRYVGVAHGAELLDAKVCDADGWCDESAMIEAMQWAADRNADVVNLSLGGEDTAEVDPVEQTVQRLTDKSDTLFVVAAGNGGPDSGTVASPASAKSALAVGAVGRDGALADFSARGPTAGDKLVKPDLTAPGVGIVAARASGTSIGAAVDEHYVHADGTSMATPHVSGAAALLTERHPGWSARQVKRALVGTARPQPAQSAYEQGAGLLDIGRAVQSTVLTRPAALSFGVQLWPHTDDTPVRKRLTYENLGNRPLTLALRTEAVGPDGKPAPDGSIALGRDRVRVPPRGSATVDVRATSQHAGPPGLYNGRVLATPVDGQAGRAGQGSKADSELVTPFGLEKERESYTLTIDHTDTNGHGTNRFDDLVFGIDGTYFSEESGSDRTTELRLPKGRYHLESNVRTGPNARPVFHMLARPLVQLDRDVRVSMDARRTKPLTVRVPDRSARPALVDIGYVRTGANQVALDSSISARQVTGIRTAQLGRAVPADAMRSRFGIQLGLPGKTGDFAGTPYIYALLWQQQGQFFSGMHKVVDSSELATVEHANGAQRAGRRATMLLNAAVGDLPGGWGYAFDVDLPSKLTTYHTTEGQSWDLSLAQELRKPSEPAEETSLTAVGRDYEAGGHYTERWNSPVFGPSFSDHNYPWVARYTDFISAEVPLFSDAHGHVGASNVDEAKTVLLADGQPIAASEMAGFVTATVDPAVAQYEIRTRARRGVVSNYSTRVDAAWTFRSVRSFDKQTLLPLWVVRFQPPVDRHGRVESTDPARLPVRVEPQTGSDVGDLTKLVVEVSMDDGKTWIPTRIKSGYGKGTDFGARQERVERRTALVSLPEPTGYVSLRTMAMDSKGNTVQQTIIRAYHVN